MNIHLSVLTLLLVATVAAGGRHVPGEAGETMVPAYYTPSEVMAYWRTVLPNTSMPSALLDHLNALADIQKNQHGHKSPYIYWSINQHEKEDGDRSPYIYGGKDHGEKSPYIYGSTDSKIANEGEKSPYIYGSIDQKKQDQGVPYIYRNSDSKIQKVGEVPPYIYGTTNQNKQGHDDKSPYIYWSGGDSKTAKEGDISPYIYGIMDQNKQDHSDISPYIYGNRDSKMEKGAEKSPYIYRSTDQNHGDKSPYIYWPRDSKMAKDGEKSPYIYGTTYQNKKDHGDRSLYIYWNSVSKMSAEAEKSPYNYGSTNLDKQNHGDKSPYIYWSSDSKIAKEGVKSPYIYGSSDLNEQGDGKSPYSYWWTMQKSAHLHQEDVKEKRPIYVEDHHYLHNHGHIGHQFDMANFLFTEDVLLPGTIVTPCIKPSTSPAPFLHHEIANSISMTAKNFPNIMKMFAPRSHALASETWSNIKSCENVLLRENQICATSMDSMIMFVTSMLGTRNLQAFSSSDVPVEGISSGSQRYKVAAARRVTAARSKKEETTLTCHGVEFPFAVFYCHAENPTRVYEVTLQSEEDVPAKTTMRALVVCHLDTSKFDPKIPFFAERNIKPGDVPLCHFLERSGILWAPAAASSQDDGTASAR